MKLSALPRIAAHLVRQAVTGKRGTMLKEGLPAPAFTAKDESGTTHLLSQYRGRKVILWFFPRASTPG
ncbi:MAG TPA: redoxin domain-containing protein [Acidobacteriota bacterium]|nr:redoxin domain-containing protein [Acidobacteriota bacterium]